MSVSRTIVLVGGTSGLGRRAAEHLHESGHRLFVVGRDPKRARDLQRRLPTAIVFHGDAATSAGVREIADVVRAETDQLDTLINSAGVMLPTRVLNSEGIELNLAVHHLAPFSMTSELLPLLRRGDGRVVNVNSEGHRAPLRGGGTVSLDFDDLNSERGYNPFMAYSRSKLANLLSTYELQRRHPELTAVAVHPGMVRTDLGRHFPRLQVALMHAISLPAQQGAAPIVALATAKRIEAGGYYNRETLARSSPASYNVEDAQRLWLLSEQLRAPFEGLVDHARSVPMR
jgi:retinol dehydrogenase-12